MSGGSYDYLCYKLEDPYPQIDPENVERMAASLRELGCTDAAEELEAIRATRPPQALIELLHAVEWRDSGDWGEGQLLTAIEDWHRQAARAERDARLLGA